MTFQALLVSKDEEAASTLTPVLSGFGISAVLCGYPEAICQVTEQKFDAVIVDFDDPHSGALVLHNVHQSPSGNRAITIALLSDKAKVRNVFGEGANFILYKPIAPQQAEASLRAATALIKRERRISFRVPVQVPVQVKLQDGPQLEGILLDLSEDGMDVLAAQPLHASASIGAHFVLPDGKTEVDVRGEVAWANPNGQAGVHFVDMPDTLRSNLKTWIAANAPEIPPADAEPLTDCKLTDLSLGGCYVETQSPFPERAGITLCLRAEGVETQVEGWVRVMHPGYGMGIEFPAHTADERAQVARFIGFLSNRPGTLPELTVTARDLTSAESADGFASPSGDELDDPLLDLLHRHESLTQEEFLQELHQQRNPEATPA